MEQVKERVPEESKLEAALKSYEADVERWKERGQRIRDIQPLAIADVLLLAALLHPTDRKESKELTRTLIEYMAVRKIVTAKHIYRDLALSDKPVLKRLKILITHGLIRKVSGRFYIATPRLYEFRKKHLKRVCR